MWPHQAQKWRLGRRGVAALAAAALHLAFLATLWHAAKPAPEPPRDRLSIVMRIVAPAANVKRAQRVPAPPPPALAGAPPLLIPPPAFMVESLQGSEANGPPPPPAGSLPEPSAPALRLSLPRRDQAARAAARSPALDDARANSARPTFERRIADAAGRTGEWTVERTSDHRTLLHRGDTCQEVRRSRIRDTDPFNENVAPRAADMVGEAYRCR